MDVIEDRLRLFLDELQAQCRQYGSGSGEFTFEREYWDPFWRPWFIYVQDQSLRFTSVDIQEEDLARLVQMGYLWELEAIELSDDDVSRGRFCLAF